MSALRGRELQAPAVQVELPRGDRLIDVAADGVELARPLIDMHDHLAMGAADRSHVGAAVELRPDALADRLVALVRQRRLAMRAQKVADAGFGFDRAGAVDLLAGLAFDLVR